MQNVKTQAEKDMVNLYRAVITILVSVVLFVCYKIYDTVYENSQSHATLITKVDNVLVTVDKLNSKVTTLENNLNYERGRNDQREKEEQRRMRFGDQDQDQSYYRIGQTEENLTDAKRIMNLGSVDSLLSNH